MVLEAPVKDPEEKHSECGKVWGESPAFQSAAKPCNSWPLPPSNPSPPGKGTRHWAQLLPLHGEMGVPWMPPPFHHFLTIQLDEWTKLNCGTAVCLSIKPLFICLCFTFTEMNLIHILPVIGKIKLGAEVTLSWTSTAVISTLLWCSFF